MSFRVPEGCIAGLVRPNGAGKTTTLRVIVGALARDYGSVEVFGEDPWVNPRLVRSLTGYLPETPKLPPVRVAHLLGHVARLKGVEDVRKEVARVAGLTRITQVLDSKASSLPAGWRQRVALAVASLGVSLYLFIVSNSLRGSACSFNIVISNSCSMLVYLSRAS